MKINEITYQLCPKCQGSGVQNHPPGIAPGSSTTLSYPCEVCGGAKVIKDLVPDQPKEDEIDWGKMDALVFMEKSFEEVWAAIEEKFDWDKVYQAMKMADWHWHESKEFKGIPSPWTIQQTAKRLLKDLWEKKQYGKAMSISTGGLCAYWDGTGISLDFTLEQVHIEYCDL
jgi:hypothetical protein